jgi:Porin PorA
MRKAAITSGVIGLVLLIAAALLAWWITPSYVARVPSDYNKTRTYDGTIHSLLNPVALATGPASAAIRRNLPVTLTDNVKVQQTSGNTALIQDTRTIKSGSTAVGSTVSHYAVDRQTLMATRSHPSGWNVTPASGLTVSWPFGAKRQTYTGWIPYTESTTSLKYVKDVQQGGTTTYEYHTTVPPTPIKNPQVLGVLPKTLPVSLLPRLEGAGLVTPAQAADLARIFPGATAIPLGYTYQASNTYFVSPATGLVVNVSNNETQMGGPRLPNGTIVPVIPVLSYSYHSTSASLSQAVNDATSGSTAITVLGVTLPIIFLSLGFVLVVLAVFLWMRKRSRGKPVEREYPRHPSPAGRVT